jgi:hypothetical protein
MRALVPSTEVEPMKIPARIVTIVLCGLLSGTVHANTYGSVEPFANTAVVDIRPLKEQPLPVREAFATRLLECGIVNRVIDALNRTGAIHTINPLNTHVAVGAGGFMGETNPSFVYTVMDDGPNAATNADVSVLTDSLGYVMSQASAFLLDFDHPAAFDFPANFVVLNSTRPPTIANSESLFRLVGQIDPELYATDTSGYTQYGRAYVSLQSAVPDERFIAGYLRAAMLAGLEYGTIVNGRPGLFQGGAAFPANDWTLNRRGEEFLSRIPRQSHGALGDIRDYHLRITGEVLRRIDRRENNVVSFECS